MTEEKWAEFLRRVFVRPRELLKKQQEIVEELKKREDFITLARYLIRHYYDVPLVVAGLIRDEKTMGEIVAEMATVRTLVPGARDKFVELWKEKLEEKWPLAKELLG